MANGTSKPKGALIAALIFFVLGLAGCGIAAATTIPFLSDLVDWVSELDDLARTNSMGETATFTADGDRGVALLTSEAACTGEGPDGAVRFESYESFGPGTDVELNNLSIDGYILFDTRTGGEYDITCGSAGTGSYLVVTAPTFLVDGFGRAGFGILSGLGGIAFMFIALILLIVGLVQRSSWKKRNQGPPPGGYGVPAAGAAPPPPGAPGAVPPAQQPPAPGVPPAQAPGVPPAQPTQPPGQTGGWGGSPQPQAPPEPPPFGGGSTPPPPPPAPPGQG